jgi:hypothetical protein
MRIWRIAECTQELAGGREVILDFTDGENCKILSIDGNELLNFGKPIDVALGNGKQYLIELPNLTVLLEDTGEEIEFCIDDDLDDDWVFVPIFEEVE